LDFGRFGREGEREREREHEGEMMRGDAMRV
jgi:hypothetical protein